MGYDYVAIRCFFLKRLLRPDRSLLTYFVLGTFGLAAFSRAYVTGISDSTLDAGEVLTLVATLGLISDLDQPLSLRRKHVFCIIIGAFAWIYPHFRTPFLAFTISSIALLCFTRAEDKIRPLARFLLAISFFEVWSRSFFGLVSSVVMPIETRMIAYFGKFILPNLAVADTTLRTSENWSVFVLEGCSSFHNTALTFIVWYSVLVMARLHAEARACLALFVSLLGTIALNSGRILLMVPSQKNFDYWHDGAGSTIVAFLTFLIAAVPLLWATGRKKSNDADEEAAVAGVH
jgi:hypothetical protein